VTDPAAPIVVDVVRVAFCSTCVDHRPMLHSFGAWYGWTTGCLVCGDKWVEGERLPRPFRPKWRRDAVDAMCEHMTARMYTGQQVDSW